MPHKKIKARTMLIVLYPESQQDAIDSIRANYSHIGILHDKDTDENGELKKAHWHFIIRFRQARWSSSLANELGIDDHFESCKSLDSACRYLLHLDHPEKYLYPASEAVFSKDNQVVFNKAISDNVTEDSCVMTIVDIIDSYPYKITYGYILRRVCELGLYGEFRRMGILAVKLIDEHNGIYE